LIFIISSPAALAVDSITFTSGAPLDEYQPRVIVLILTEAFARHDIKFSAVHLPSLRSLAKANSGEFDGELHRVANLNQITNNQYPNLIKVETKLLSVDLTVFTKKKLSIVNWADLGRYNIAYHRGRNNVAKLLANSVITGKIYKVKSDRQAFGMLAAGRVDAVISEKITGHEIINTNIRFEHIVESKILHRSDIHSYTHHKHKKILPRLVKTLNEMKQSGRFEQIKQQALKNHITSPEY